MLEAISVYMDRPTGRLASLVDRVDAWVGSQQYVRVMTVVAVVAIGLGGWLLMHGQVAIGWNLGSVAVIAGLSRTLDEVLIGAVAYGFLLVGWVGHAADMLPAEGILVAVVGGILVLTVYVIEVSQRLLSSQTQ